MSEARPSTPQMHTIRLLGEQRHVMFDPAPLDWSAANTNLYNRPGVQMVLGGQVTQPIWDYVGLLLSSAYVTRLATAEQGLTNFLFKGAYTPGMDSTTFKLMRLQEAKVYSKFEDVLAQDRIRWTNGERTKRTTRLGCEADSTQFNALANGVELSSEDLQMLGKGLVSIVGWLMELSMEPLAIDLWTREDVLKLSQD
jgi:hypothetical protein